MLIKAADHHRLAAHHRSGIGLLAAAEQIQQRGFAHPVGADKAHPILRGERIGEVVDQTPIAELALQVLNVDHRFAKPPASALHRHVLFGRFEALFLHLLDALNPGFLFGASCFGAAFEPFDFAAHYRAVSPLPGRIGNLFLVFLFQVGAVVAWVAAQLAAIQLNDRVGDTLEEVAVVGDQDQSAFEALQEPLEPFGR